MSFINKNTTFLPEMKFILIHRTLFSSGISIIPKCDNLFIVPENWVIIWEKYPRYSSIDICLNYLNFTIFGDGWFESEIVKVGTHLPG